MSLQAMLGPYAAQLLEARTVDELKNILFSIFTSAAPIDMRTPLKIRNHTNQDVIQIVNTGRDDWHGIAIRDSDGKSTTLGIGLGTSGVLANEIVPDRNFTLDATVVSQHYAGDRVGSGYGEGASGSGVAGTVDNGVIKGGWGRLLDSYTKSPQTWHPPSTADQFSLNGNRKWWPSDPCGWMVLHCRVVTVNADTLTCLVLNDGSGSDPASILGSTITVCKPWWLTRTPFDGQTVGGITYSYITNQRRTANNGLSIETQVVHPGYQDADTYADPSEIYVRWSANGTDAATVWYIDLNTDARTWVAV